VVVSGYEFTPPPEKVPDTRSATSGGPPQPPPKPPKLTSRDLLEPGDPGKRIFLEDYIEVRELAAMLGLKPFKLVAEVIKLGIFKHADELVDFATATVIAGKHGFVVERLL
jgi:translation initiation factor IF-2